MTEQRGTDEDNRTSDVRHVETDMAFAAFQPGSANRLAVHWRSDPQFHTQVNYRRETPCLLVVEPAYGPAQTIEPGGSFESFRTFELVHDATDRARRGLALRRMYRTIAPWVTENPLMMHMRTANPDYYYLAGSNKCGMGYREVNWSLPRAQQVIHTRQNIYDGTWYKHRSL